MKTRRQTMGMMMMMMVMMMMMMMMMMRKWGSKTGTLFLWWRWWWWWWWENGAPKRARFFYDFWTQYEILNNKRIYIHKHLILWYIACQLRMTTPRHGLESPPAAFHICPGARLWGERRLLKAKGLWLSGFVWAPHPYTLRLLLKLFHLWELAANQSAQQPLA